MSVLISHSLLSPRSSFKPYFYATAITEREKGKFPPFSTADDICTYARAKMFTMDTNTLCRFLRYTSDSMVRIPNCDSFRYTATMKTLVVTAVKAVPLQDPTLASRLIYAVSTMAPRCGLPIPVPAHLKSAGNRFFDLIKWKKVSFTEENFARVITSLCRLGVRGAQFRLFLHRELPKQIPQMDARACSLIIKVLFDLDIQNEQLQMMLNDRLNSELERYRKKDVIPLLMIFSRVNFHPPYAVINKCIEFLEANSDLIGGDELISAAESLVTLQHFSFSVASRICNELNRKLYSLSSTALNKLLNILVCSPTAESDLANEAIGILISSNCTHIFAENIAHTICAFNLQGTLHLQKWLVKLPMLPILLRSYFFALTMQREYSF